MQLDERSEIAPALIRHYGAGGYFEAFFVSAIAAILGIRVFLELTGYPTVGGDALHIAHMLWGGLLMLIALLLLIGFIGGAVRGFAAIVGGLGFGAFIDELGKFITHDNDYFYRPTFALIYILFVLLYVGYRAVHRRSLAPVERVANALELMQEAVRHDLDPDEKRHALALLEKGDAGDPVVAALRRALEEIDEVREPRHGFARRLRDRVRALYGRLIRTTWFPTAVVVFFVAHSAIGLIQGIILLPRVAEGLALAVLAGFLAWALVRAVQQRRARTGLFVGLGLAATVAVLVTLLTGSFQVPELAWTEWADLVFSVLPALIVVAGVIRLPESRLGAYQLFRRAVLILIFITQVFAFYQDQLLAVVGLLANILVLITLHAVIRLELEERDRRTSRA
jgi:hypothetical protein